MTEPQGIVPSVGESPRAAVASDRNAAGVSAGAVLRNPVAWHIAADADRVDPGEVDWFRLPALDGACCVKTGDGRSTWRLECAGRLYYVKVFERSGRSRWSRVAARLRRGFASRAWGDHPAAAREWVAFQRAACEGIPMIRALALGTEIETGRSVLITEGVTDAQSLADAWIGHRASDRGGAVPNPAVRPLVRAVAVLLASTHDRGFLHMDGHARNFLVRGVVDGALDCVFADPYPVRFGTRAVSRRDAVRSLAQLDQFFRHAATRAQRLRFLIEYLGLRTRGPKPIEGRRGLRDWVAAITAHRQRATAVLAAHRDRRLHRADGKYFVRLTLPGGWRGVVACLIGRRHLFPEPQAPNRTAGDWQRLLRELGLERVATSACGEIGRRGGVTAELSRPEGIVQRLTWTIRRSPAQRAFRRSHGLRHRDQPAELILGYLEQKRWGLLDRVVILREDRMSTRPEHRPGVGIDRPLKDDDSYVR